MNYQLPTTNFPSKSVIIELLRTCEELVPNFSWLLLSMKHQKSTIGIKEALLGLLYTVRTQNNFKIQIIAAILVVNLGIFFQITKFEWLDLLLAVALVLVSEMINTALEAAVDLTVSDLNPTAKIVKDTAAGAVLAASLFALVVGTIIFLPYFQILLKN